MNTMFAWAPSAGEIILVLAVVLVLFGAKKIPELAKGLGTGIKEFKKASREVSDEIQNASDEQKKPSSNGQSQTAQSGSQSSNPPKA